MKKENETKTIKLVLLSVSFLFQFLFSILLVISIVNKVTIEDTTTLYATRRVQRTKSG